MTKAHARLSPSGSKRWLACPGSLTLEEAYPNKSSEYADDGTAMHSVASIVLENTEFACASFIDEEIVVSTPDEEKRTVKFTEDMAERTQAYVDTVRALAEGHELHVELRLPFTEYLTMLDGEEDEEQFGTADAVILRNDGEMLVIDLKTGYRFVPVEWNTQLMIYALAAYARFELSHNIEHVRICIWQDGMREWRVSVPYLLAWAKETLAPGALLVDKARAMYRGVENEADFEDWAGAWLNPNPNEVECAFCRAIPTCPAYRAKIEREVGASFDDLSEGMHPVEPVTDEQLSKAMTATYVLEMWSLKVRAEVERRLLAGGVVSGFGLQLGRAGNRKWKDEKASEAALTALVGDKAYAPKTLLSPTKVEELTKKKAGRILTEEQWKELQKGVVRSDPKPSVKPASQITESYNPTAKAADSFDAVPE